MEIGLKFGNQTSEDGLMAVGLSARGTEPVNRYLLVMSRELGEWQVGGQMGSFWRALWRQVSF